MNLADPELELIDPTPNVHSMFMHFDKTFFWTKLASRCIVKWSKRMYSCAGTCTYEISCGLCKITLSEPLLKLRPRKDLVETLLHEMIHAFLFVTNRDQDRDGHGPNFKAHMHRINRAAGLNISIYHDFHDEVELYQTHWWRCDGPCQQRRPHFGIVRRTCNRPPGPSDYWWNSHKRNCGGTFIKIKEPEKPVKVAKEPKNKKIKAKPNADITKYVNNNNDKGISNKNNIPKDNITKDTNNLLNKTNIGVKSNSSSTLVINKKNVIFNPQVTKPKPVVFTGSGQTITDVNKRTSSGNVLETVRNVWANKQIGMNNKKVGLTNSNSSVPTPSKHKAESHTDSPPPKMKKIDDYFKSTASSMLKDLYGQDFKVTQSENKEKLIAVSTVTTKKELDFNTTQSKTNEKSSTVVQAPEKSNLSLVSCPVCSLKIETSKINGHLDECLNKNIIDELSQRSITPESEHQKPVVNSTSNEKCKPKELSIIPPKPTVKKEKVTQNVKEKCDNIIDLSNIELISDANHKRRRLSSDQVDLIKPETDKRNKDCRKSDSFIVPKVVQEQNKTIETPKLDLRVPQINIEPSSSKDDVSVTECPCCGDKLDKTVDEHLEECLSFLENDTTIPEEGASTSFGNETIVIDDDNDDMFDESQTMNATGTKLPCPCCLKMVEEIDMNKHLDKCLK